MITVLMPFFVLCGIFLVASALALQFGLRVPQFMAHRSAFGQLCQGTSTLFLAALCATTSATLVTWVMAALAPLLMVIGLRLDVLARRQSSAERTLRRAAP